MRRACLLGCLLTACSGPGEPDPSTELSTSELRLGATVRSNGDVTLVEASLFPVEPITITLTDPDRLLVALGDVEAQLVPFQGSHIGQIARSGTDAALIFERLGGVRITSHVTLPPLFALSPPASPSESLTITWGADPGDFETRVQVDSACFISIHKTFATDPGAFTLDPSDIQRHPDVTSCDVSIEVSRWIFADMPASPFAPGGKSSAAQIRTIVFSSP